MLGKLSVPGRVTYLGNSRAGAYCACSAGRGCLDIFLSSIFSLLFSFSLSGRRPDID